MLLAACGGAGRWGLAGFLNLGEVGKPSFFPSDTLLGRPRVMHLAKPKGIRLGKLCVDTGDQPWRNGLEGL